MEEGKAHTGIGQMCTQTRPARKDMQLEKLRSDAKDVACPMRVTHSDVCNVRELYIECLQTYPNTKFPLGRRVPQFLKTCR